MCLSIRKSIQSLPRLQLSMRLCGAPVPHLSAYPSCRFAHLPNAPAVREPHSCAAFGMAPLVRAASGRFWIRRRNISAGDELPLAIVGAFSPRAGCRLMSSSERPSGLDSL